jgi:hypothetical protein
MPLERGACEHQEGGFPLGRWVLAQRRLHRSGKLPLAQEDLLSAMPGGVWDWREDRWAQFLPALGDFAAREGHLRVPQGYREGSYRLGEKVAATRWQHKEGGLAAERVRQLEQLPGWVWRGGPERRQNATDGHPNGLAPAGTVEGVSPGEVEHDRDSDMSSHGGCPGLVGRES